MNVPIPKVIGGKYRVLAQIGKGGMATVYSAVHVGTDRRVAVKVMTTLPPENDPDASSSGRGGSLARFEREARIVGNLETQHVARVFDTGLDPVHGPFIVMELLTGDDLKDLVLRLGPLRPDLALRIVGQACIGLARAHAAGVVHRDVKTSNVFLANTEFGNRVVKVLDFGIAKGQLNEHVDPSESKTLTKTGAMLGSPHYMSPEQVLGAKGVDHRSDIWSLGIVLYKCLSARTPFDDRDTIGQIIVRIVQGAPPSVQDFAPWVSPEIAAIVNRALRQRPEDRYGSAEEMSEALSAAVATRELEILPTMLTPMSDDERRDVKPRLSTRITIPDGVLATQRRSAPDAGDPPPPAEENDSTINTATATASLRGEAMLTPSPRWSALGSKVGIALVALAAGGAAVWGFARRSEPTPVPVVASAAPFAEAAATAPVPPATSAEAPSHDVDVQVQPPNASVFVDDVAVVVTKGAVGIHGILGSVHKVRVRAGGREATFEVIVAADGARPHLVTLPDVRGNVPASNRRNPTPSLAQSAPQPAKSAARFDTQFE